MAEKLVGRRKRLPHENVNPCSPMWGGRFRLPTLTIQRLHDHWWASRPMVTPFKKLAAVEAASANPIPAGSNPASRRIIFDTLPASAPSAMRIPISLRRRATRYDIAHYSPIIASNVARAAKNPENIAITRSSTRWSRTIVLKTRK